MNTERYRNSGTITMIAALPGREKLWQALSGAAVFLAISALLFFRNTQIFLAPEPWAEDIDRKSVV